MKTADAPNGIRHRAGSVFVITGPILERGRKKIGRANKVSVPRRFYKIVYDETPPRKMIAFVLPNEDAQEAMSDYSLWNET